MADIGPFRRSRGDSRLARHFLRLWRQVGSRTRSGLDDNHRRADAGNPRHCDWHHQDFRRDAGRGGSGQSISATAGIGEALITTAAGLVASLVILFPYNIIAAMIDKADEEA
ncbi:MAG: MotA/TolQ/ExbB proton channel family protein [Kiritimatiellae bacterium]|nr:MotA/TolQ/ExbB proton channel family protein [Kiritimatiellia bacterium]